MHRRGPRAAGAAPAAAAPLHACSLTRARASLCCARSLRSLARCALCTMAAFRTLGAGVIAFVLHVQFTVATSGAENGAKKPVVIDAHVHMVSSTNGLDYLWAQPPSSLSPPRTCPCAPPCMCNWTQTEYSVASATLKPTHVIL